MGIFDGMKDFFSGGGGGGYQGSPGGMGDGGMGMGYGQPYAGQPTDLSWEMASALPPQDVQELPPPPPPPPWQNMQDSSWQGPNENLMGGLFSNGLIGDKKLGKREKRLGGIIQTIFGGGGV